MGDNKRWFKVWTSIIMDQDFMVMSMEDRGIWMTLGALTAHNGENGTLSIKTKLLTHLLHITEDVTVLQEKISALPNIKVNDCCNGTCIVTFKNWHKYQVDSSAERVSKYRQNVTMQEEKRREENKKRKEKNNTGRFLPPSIDQVREYCKARNNNVNPESWINHYQAKNWMIGKNKMKDWQAAVRTWENKQTGGNNGHTEKQPTRPKGLGDYSEFEQ